MRVAFVVQRYGEEVIGGAETHARRIAERLVATHAWQLDVLTTTALDYRTWQTHYPAGTSMLNGVRVVRFPCRFQRHPLLFGVFNRLCAPLFPRFRRREGLVGRLLGGLERLWYILQGPYCPDLLQTLSARLPDYERVFFFTYLYYPTIFGIPLCRTKAVVIPTAHDEPAFYFPRSQAALGCAPLHLVNSPAEERLLQRTLPTGKRRRYVQAGIGLELDAVSSERVDEAPVRLRGRYLLYLGRISRGKGVPSLITHFIAYARANPGPDCPSLVLAGVCEEDVHIPTHPLVHYLGFLSEEAKASVLRRAAALVNPSAFESLSLIVLEALAAHVPVLVNAHSEVLRDYCRVSRTVFSYANEEEFSSQLALVLARTSEPGWVDELGASARWVRENHTWARVLAIYADAALGLPASASSRSKFSPLSRPTANPG